MLSFDPYISAIVAGFIQVGITALANLTAAAAASNQQQRRPPTKTLFDVEKEIVPFVWKYWDNICTKRSRSGNWKANLSNKLVSVPVYVLTELSSHYRIQKLSYSLKKMDCTVWLIRYVCCSQ